MNAQTMILFVDDDKEDCGILQDAFEDFNAQKHIHFEENGEKALEYVARCHTANALPCLIVLDLNMPRMNGTQTLKHLKLNENYKHIPVVIYSTSLNGIEKDECMRLGAYDYIMKPLTYQECIDTAKKLYELCLQFSGTTSQQ